MDEQAMTTWAEKVAAMISVAGHDVNIWSNDDGDRFRVYVSRQLSKGKQTMGYIEVRNDGDSNEPKLAVSMSAERIQSQFDGWKAFAIAAMPVSEVAGE